MKLMLSKAVQVDRVGCETVITCANGDMLVLNDTGTLVFDAAIGASPDEAAQRAAHMICEKYGTPYDEARRDATSLIRKLQARGVLVPSEWQETSANAGRRFGQVRAIPSVSRRAFVAGAAALGVTFLNPATALGRESAAVATAAFGEKLTDDWAEGGATRMWSDSTGRLVAVPPSPRRLAPYGPYAQAVLECIAPESVVQISAKGQHASSVLSVQRLASADIVANDAVAEADAIAASPIASADDAKADTAAESVGSVSLAAVEWQAPDLIIDMGSAQERLAPLIDEVQAESGVPVVHLAASLDTLPQALRSLGDLLEAPEASTIADYVARALVTFAQGREAIKAMGEGAQKTVYYGQGEGGLATRSAGTLLDSIITLIGARNAAEALTEQECMSVPVGTVSAWAPDLIIISVDHQPDAAERESLLSVWERASLPSSCTIAAIPAYPFAWLSRSPLTMQTLGALWLANLLYPGVYDYDMAETLIEYFNLFFHIELTRARAGELLSSAILLAPEAPPIESEGDAPDSKAGGADEESPGEADGETGDVSNADRGSNAEANGRQTDDDESAFESQDSGSSEPLEVQAEGESR